MTTADQIATERTPRSEPDPDAMNRYQGISQAVMAGIKAAWLLGDDSLASRLIDVHVFRAA